MRIFLFLLLGFPFLLSAQAQTADSLVSAGIRLYRQGLPQQATAKYEAALRLDKRNGRALYELAYAAFERGAFREAIRYTTRMRRYRTAALVRAYQLEGSAYDELDLDKKAIKRFRQGLQRYPDNYLLHYNLALTYFQNERFPEAITQLEAALVANPTHASSHYMLGYIWTAYENKLPAALALQFFLLLEPDSPRSKQALDLLEDCLQQIATKRRPQVPAQPANVIAAADRTAALTFAQLPLDGRPVDLAGRLRVLDTVCAAQFGPAVATQDAFFWTFYADFIVNVVHAGHLEALSYFITQQRGGASFFWLEGHQPEVRALFDWLASIE